MLIADGVLVLCQSLFLSQLIGLSWKFYIKLCKKNGMPAKKALFTCYLCGVNRRLTGYMLRTPMRAVFVTLPCFRVQPV